MADETMTKKVTDLTESTEPTDEDLFLAGSAGTASLRKIKWSNIWTKITSSILNKLVANNLITTAAGFLLDARQGKVLDDKLTELNTNMEWKKAGSSYNTNSISVPSTAKEVKVMVIVKLTDTTVPLVFDFSYINEFPLNSQQFRTVGYYYGSNDWASIGIGTSVNGVWLQSSWTKLKYSGTEYTLSSVASYSIHVYYR